MLLFFNKTKDVSVDVSFDYLFCLGHGYIAKRMAQKNENLDVLHAALTWSFLTL